MVKYFVILAFLSVNITAKAQQHVPSHTLEVVAELPQGDAKNTHRSAINAAPAAAQLDIEIGEANATMQNILANGKCDACQDEMLAYWLEDFVLLQKGGKSANEASQLASTAALMSYYLCDMASQGDHYAPSED